MSFPVWRVFRLLSLLSAGVGVLPVGCTRSIEPATVQSVKPALFRDVAASAGVRFTHSNGATGKFYYVEETGAGCAFFDYDNDGFLDIYLVQSGAIPRAPGSRDPKNFGALYHNNGDGTFTDVTAGSGLDTDLGYGQGIAVGDYNNDGFDDLYISGYGGNYLLRNDGGSGKFTDVTEQARVGDTDQGRRYAVSSAFGDYDNDGDLDLYVCHYALWSPETNKICHTAKGTPDYCTPDVLDSDADRFYRNNGDGTFTDVTRESGIGSRLAHGMGVIWTDYNNDGWEDIFVSNDLTPQFLWHNNGDGTFTNRSEEAGCAFDYNASHLAGMGIGLGDYDNSGRESIFVTNFSQQPNTLFRNAGDGLFEDVSMQTNVALPHMNFLAFGCDFLDYDADGWRDLIVANGHVVMSIAETTEGVTYKERKQLFRNNGAGRFDEITENLGDLGIPVVSRGLASGDYDNDGRVDFVVSNQNSPVQLFRNEVPLQNRWIRFKTVGTRSNRNGYHAKITVTCGDRKYFSTVHSSSSYASHSDSRPYFGLGSADKVDRVEIVWPSGTRDELTDLEPNTTYVITEGKGITGTQPGARADRTASPSA
ncbi:MAG: CRTAC1 family protein [Armatimonadaceae bacterium]